jgi:hypothetical protein
MCGATVVDALILQHKRIHHPHPRLPKVRVTTVKSCASAVAAIKLPLIGIANAAHQAEGLPPQ